MMEHYVTSVRHLAMRAATCAHITCYLQSAMAVAEKVAAVLPTCVHSAEAALADETLQLQLLHIGSIRLQAHVTRVLHLAAQRLQKCTQHSASAQGSAQA
jgi:hypothetical protein